jgi:hypothetical protein
VTPPLRVIGENPQAAPCKNEEFPRFTLASLHPIIEDGAKDLSRVTALDRVRRLLYPQSKDVLVQHAEWIPHCAFENSARRPEPQPNEVTRLA